MRVQSAGIEPFVLAWHFRVCDITLNASSPRHATSTSSISLICLSEFFCGPGQRIPNMPDG